MAAARAREDEVNNLVASDCLFLQIELYAEQIRERQGHIYLFTVGRDVSNDSDGLLSILRVQDYYIVTRANSVMC